MRSELGVLLVEDDKGEVAVQLFAEVLSVERAFRELVGSPAEKPKRATLVTLRYGEDGEVQVSTLSKMLSVIESVEDKPDGYMLGEGPVKFKKDASIS